jgi:hypothetical protein
MRTLSALLPILLSSAAVADTITIKCDRDNTMYEEDVSLSNGAGNSIFSGTIASGDANPTDARSCTST